MFIINKHKMSEEQADRLRKIYAEAIKGSDGFIAVAATQAGGKPT